MLQRDKLLGLARRYVWYTQPDAVIDADMRLLIASAMERGSWQDAHALLQHVGEQAFADVLYDHPAGALSAKSLAFWHCRLGLPGDPPEPRVRQFDH